MVGRRDAREGFEEQSVLLDRRQAADRGDDVRTASGCPSDLPGRDARASSSIARECREVETQRHDVILPGRGRCGDSSDSSRRIAGEMATIAIGAARQQPLETDEHRRLRCAEIALEHVAVIGVDRCGRASAPRPKLDAIAASAPTGRPWPCACGRCPARTRGSSAATRNSARIVHQRDRTAQRVDVGQRAPRAGRGSVMSPSPRSRRP